MTATVGRQAAREKRAARVDRRWSHAVVLLTVFASAACGLAYELALISLGGYLIGDAVGQAAIVLGVTVFAMGVGALSARALQGTDQARAPQGTDQARALQGADRAGTPQASPAPANQPRPPRQRVEREAADPATGQVRAAMAFGVVEVALSLLGGLSVLGLYAAFAWLDLFAPALIAIAFVLGALLGAQLPLMLSVLRRHRAGDLITVGHVGAMLGGLAFPFLIVPALGQLRGALVVGVVNAVAGAALVFALFRAHLGRQARIGFGAAFAAVVLILGYAYGVAGDFEVTARQQLYRDPVVHAERSRYQEIVLTRSLAGDPPDLRLYLDGDLQFSSVDEYRYHEALVHPALSGPHERVLIVGGGDGLALREVLRYKDVSSVTLVERDPAMLRLGQHDARLRTLNDQSFEDRRVKVVTADPFDWLRDNSAGFDAVIVDLPDPDETGLAKLYSTEFYALLRPSLAPGARLAVQAGSPYFAPEAFWCVEATLRAGGFATTPYHVDVPSFGDWGFVLAATGAVPPNLLLADRHPELRFLDRDVLEAAGVFPPDRERVAVQPSTLIQPRVLDYARGRWRGY